MAQIMRAVRFWFCVFMNVGLCVYTSKAERQILQTWSITVALMQALLITRHDGAAN